MTNLRKRLYQRALRLLGDAGEAEDVVQDVLARGWQQRDRILGLDNPPAWLMRMTHNRAIDELRARAVRRRRETAAAPADRDGRTPYRLLATDDALRRVHRLLEELPPDHQRVLRLREAEGLTYAEIAARTGLTLAQVKTNLHRGRTKLRALLLAQNLK